MSESRLLLTSWLMALTLVGATQAGPQMAVDADRFDFGYAPLGAVVSHTFWIKSIGDSDLVINEVKPGCGCTKAPLEKNTIKPGDSARLEIIFTSKNYRDLVTKKIKIKSNASQQDRELTIMADLISDPAGTSPVVFTPMELDISPLSARPRTEMPFVISNKTNTWLQLRLLEWPRELLELNLPDSIAPGEEVGALLRLTPRGQQQAFEKSVTFEFDDLARSRFTLPIKRALKN